MESVLLLTGLGVALLLISSAFSRARRRRDDGFATPTVSADAGGTEGELPWGSAASDPSDGFNGGDGDFGGGGASGDWDVGDIGGGDGGGGGD